MNNINQQPEPEFPSFTGDLPQSGDLIANNQEDLPQSTPDQHSQATPNSDVPEGHYRAANGEVYAFPGYELPKYATPAVIHDQTESSPKYALDGGVSRDVGERVVRKLVQPEPEYDGPTNENVTYMR